MKKNVVSILILMVSFTFLSMTILKAELQEPWKVPPKYEKMANPHADDADAEHLEAGDEEGREGEGDGADVLGLSRLHVVDLCRNGAGQ